MKKERKRNPILVYLFECTNILGCIVFPFLIIFNAGGKFYPTEDIYSVNEILICIRNMMITSVVFATFIGIPLLLLLVDCFVIMRGVKGFQVSALSVITAPATYPIVRTEVLQEPSKQKRLHVIAGSVIFVSNCFVILAFVQYLIRIILAMLPFLP